MDRRRFVLSLGSLSGSLLFHDPALGQADSQEAASAIKDPDTPAVPEKRSDRIGHLVIIGGAEDRKNDKALLRRFVELTGVDDPLIIVITAASAYQDEIWQVYEPAFRQLGVKRLIRLEIESRADANNKDLARRVFEADGVFITGGDQQRLMSTIGGTYTAEAIFRAFRERGICVGGTSAGAAVMSLHMIANGKGKQLPGKGNATMSPGLGLVRGAVIDQHFSQRQRLGRLLSLVAQAPFLLGVGIDENTALVIERGRGLEVIGQGAITIIDGGNMTSNFFDIGSRELLEMLNIKMHLLPGGARYYLTNPQVTVADEERSRQSAPTGSIPASLQSVVSILTDV